MFLAITSVPAVLALTLTLPVVDDGTGDEGGLALPTDVDYPGDDISQLSEYDEDADVIDGERLLSADVGEELHNLVEGNFSPLHSPLGRIRHSALRRMASHSDDGSSDGYDDDQTAKELMEEIRQEEALEFHKDLTAVQCVLGPAFCVLVIFGEFLLTERKLTYRRDGVFQVDHARICSRGSCRGYHDSALRDRRPHEDMAVGQVFRGVHLQYGLDRCDRRRSGQRLAGEENC